MQSPFFLHQKIPENSDTLRTTMAILKLPEEFYVVIITCVIKCLPFEWYYIRYSTKICKIIYFKYWTSINVADIDHHTSLLQNGINYCIKKFFNKGPYHVSAQNLGFLFTELLIDIASV